MRTSRFTPEEVLALLREAQNGTLVRDICIRTGINETTFYRWKSQYEGLDPSGVRRLRELEQENSQLRRTVGLQDIQIDVLKGRLEAAAQDGRRR